MWSGLGADLQVAPDTASERLLQPVQRRLPGHRRAVLAAGLELAGEHGHDGIVPELVVIPDQVRD